jgi:hypothetical protein
MKMNKLEIARVLASADERIRRLERNFNEQQEKLSIHEHYMRVTAKLVHNNYGVDCCEDRLGREISCAAHQMEYEFHYEQEMETQANVASCDESEDCFADVKMKIHPSLHNGEYK